MNSSTKVLFVVLMFLVQYFKLFYYEKEVQIFKRAWYIFIYYFW